MALQVELGSPAVASLLLSTDINTTVVETIPLTPSLPACARTELIGHPLQEFCAGPGGVVKRYVQTHLSSVSTMLT